MPLTVISALIHKRVTSIYIWLVHLAGALSAEYYLMLSSITTPDETIWRFPSSGTKCRSFQELKEISHIIGDCDLDIEFYISNLYLTVYWRDGGRWV